MDLSGNVEKILGMLTKLAVQEFLLAWGLERDLKRLETSLSSINAVILDAQEQQTTNHRLGLWLRQLKQVLYDAEDVLDDFAYQGLRNQVVSTHGDINRKVRRFFSGSNPMVYRLRIGHRIKDIRQRLDEINANKNEFNLAANLQADNGHIQQFKKREMTHSFVNSSDIIGRDADREIIVQFLMDSPSRDEIVSTIPIVGIGGLGKTALAKFVFNDERVAEHFDLKVWVCLGDMKEFNVNQATANIVKSLLGEKKIDDSNLQYLQSVIRDELQNKRFLLVLDDTWDVNRDKWLELKALFTGSARGSKIVVTTRISSVASCVGTVPAHRLNGLPHDDCVLLFKKLAFASDGEVDQNLMNIGNEIVRKCKGVPLAVCSIGSLMFSKSNEREWLLVRDSDIWQKCQNDILPILKFSYDHLSSSLKQCFVYCSVFPEDHEFIQDRLIAFWMVHGLLKAPKKGPTLQQLEDIGEQYIQELLSKGFFHDFDQYSRFRMHDLVRELACSFGGEEFAIINADGQNISEIVRHVFFQVENFSVNSTNAIQSVLSDNLLTTNTVPEACITKFKHLKFLDLQNSEFEELPKFIGTLKHLRYLNLSVCDRLKRLPDSIYKLHNLQTLLLFMCNELEELPKRMYELINLRKLELVTKQKHLPEIERLASLEYLQLSNCPNVEVLFEGNQLHLTSLRTLIVSYCESLISFFPLSTSTNYCLPALELLQITRCSNLDLNLMDQQHDHGPDIVSHCLQLPSLKSLNIYGVETLEDTWPMWIQGCANTLQCLEIIDCSNLTALPQWLPTLTSLRILYIQSCRELKSLPLGMERLTNLNKIYIIDCGELMVRCNKETGEDWPKIAHIPNITIRRF